MSFVSSYAAELSIEEVHLVLNLASLCRLISSRQTWNWGQSPLIIFLVCGNAVGLIVKRHSIRRWSEPKTSSDTLQFLTSLLMRGPRVNVTSMIVWTSLLKKVKWSPLFWISKLCWKIHSSKNSPRLLVSMEFHKELWALVSAQMITSFLFLSQCWRSLFRMVGTTLSKLMSK